MRINKHYQALIDKVQRHIELPDVAEVVLPAAGEERDDEFGFVFLEDGSVGPFYTRLGDTLQALTTRFSSRTSKTGLSALLTLFASNDLADRALALGAFNAMSAHLMDRANFSPAPTSASTGGEQPAPGETIGMVGYFCPLVDRLLDKGCDVLVIEHQPERVAARARVRVSTDPNDLAACRIVLCTASTLINNSLDEILAAATHAQSFNLIGPSSSGLPDILFSHGVTSAGGVAFRDPDGLRLALSNNASWGKTGIKYQLTPENYPGVDVLLESMA